MDIDRDIVYLRAIRVLVGGDEQLECNVLAVVLSGERIGDRIISSRHVACIKKNIRNREKRRKENGEKQKEERGKEVKRERTYQIRCE